MGGGRGGRGRGRGEKGGGGVVSPAKVNVTFLSC